MSWSNDLIGRCSLPKTHHIQHSVLEQFARALDLSYPPYFDSQAAKAAGYRDIIAPPTFAVTLKADPIPGLDFPKAGIIHGEQQFTFNMPITAGDEILVVQCVESLKQRGSTIFLSIKTTGSNPFGDEIFISRSLLIINLDLNQGKEEAQ